MEKFVIPDSQNIFNPIQDDSQKWGQLYNSKLQYRLYQDNMRINLMKEKRERDSAMVKDTVTQLQGLLSFDPNIINSKDKDYVSSRVNPIKTAGSKIIAGLLEGKDNNFYMSEGKNLLSMANDIFINDKDFASKVTNNQFILNKENEILKLTENNNYFDNINARQVTEARLNNLKQLWADGKIDFNQYQNGIQGIQLGLSNFNKLDKFQEAMGKIKVSKLSYDGLGQFATKNETYSQEDIQNLLFSAAEHLGGSAANLLAGYGNMLVRDVNGKPVTKVVKGKRVNVYRKRALTREEIIKGVDDEGNKIKYHFKKKSECDSDDIVCNRVLGEVGSLAPKGSMEKQLSTEYKAVTAWEREQKGKDYDVAREKDKTEHAQALKFNEMAYATNINANMSELSFLERQLLNSTGDDKLPIESRMKEVKAKLENIRKNITTEYQYFANGSFDEKQAKEAFKDYIDSGGTTETDNPIFSLEGEVIHNKYYKNYDLSDSKNITEEGINKIADSYFKASTVLNDGKGIFDLSFLRNNKYFKGKTDEQLNLIIKNKIKDAIKERIKKLNDKNNSDAILSKYVTLQMVLDDVASDNIDKVWIKHGLMGDPDSLAKNMIALQTLKPNGGLTQQMVVGSILGKDNQGDIREDESLFYGLKRIFSNAETIYRKSKDKDIDAVIQGMKKNESNLNSYNTINFSRSDEVQNYLMNVLIKNPGAAEMILKQDKSGNYNPKDVLQSPNFTFKNGGWFNDKLLINGTFDTKQGLRNVTFVVRDVEKDKIWEDLHNMSIEYNNLNWISQAPEDQAPLRAMAGNSQFARTTSKLNMLSVYLKSKANSGYKYYSEDGTITKKVQDFTIKYNIDKDHKIEKNVQVQMPNPHFVTKQQAIDAGKSEEEWNEYAKHNEQNITIIFNYNQPNDLTNRFFQLSKQAFIAKNIFLSGKK